MLITSKENELVKYVRKLREKKYRDEYNVFIVEGLKMVEEAIKEKADIEKIVVCEEYLNDNITEKELLYELAKEDVVYVNDKVFKYITDVVSPQGILAIIKKNKIDKINYKENLFLILDNIQDPGNMGTILRTADSIRTYSDNNSKRNC